MDDAKIIRLYQERAQEAIAESGRVYGGYCYQVAYRILGSHEDAEECVSDTWLRVWQAIPPAVPRVLRLFLAKITRNLALDRYAALRAEKRGGGAVPLLLSELSEALPSGAGPEEQLSAEELAGRLAQFAKRLPWRERSLFLRRYFYGESPAELAADFGLSAHHVTVILGRTRKKLRAALEKEGFLL